MDLNPGFKHTEAGAIPDDWTVKSLDQISLVTSGKRLPLGKSLTDHETAHPYIRVTDMRPGTVSLSDLRFVPVDVFPSIKRYRIFKDDIFISVAGSLGIVGRIPVELDGANLTENADRITNISCSQGFLLHVMMAPPIQSTIESLRTVGAQPKLALTRIRKFAIPLPPTKAEQEAIAEALSDADALIESLEQLLAKKRHIKQGAMQELLTGKKRLPGFEIKAGFKQTEVWAIPEDWEVKRLGEIGDALIGLTYKPADVRPDGILVLRSSNVQDGSLRFDDNVFVETEVPDRIMVRPGDILICVRNGSRDLIGKCARIDGRAEGMTFGAFMAVFRSPFHSFIFHQFQSSIIKRQIHEHLGATINQITNKSLNSFVIPLPPTEAEQDAIATILSEMDAEIATLEAKLTKARALKQGMMQELLTGRIRLV